MTHLQKMNIISTYNIPMYNPLPYWTFHSDYESMTISRTLIGWRVGHDNE